MNVRKRPQFLVFALSSQRRTSQVVESMWYGMLKDEFDTIRYDTLRYDTIRYDTIRYETIRYDTIRYDTIPFVIYLESSELEAEC